MDRLVQLQAMMRDKPDDPFLLFAIALEYIHSDIDESRCFFDRLVNEYPEYVATYYQYGKMEEECGNTAKATQLYTTGIEKAKDAADEKTARELQQALEMMD